MIDNIKRFVNEHHTLMVVIIGVLVIYFLYWFLCREDGHPVVKVKGGEVSLGIFLSQIDGQYYKIFGLKLKLTEYSMFPVISLFGEYWFRTNGIFDKYNSLRSVFADEIKDIMNTPEIIYLV